jgi:phospholipase C
MDGKSKLIAGITNVVAALAKVGGWIEWQFDRLLTKRESGPVDNPDLGTSPFRKINYFFVLMLENRSFDHMLGYSGIPGVDGLTGKEFNLYDLAQQEGRKLSMLPAVDSITSSRCSEGFSITTAPALIAIFGLLFFQITTRC